MFLLAYVDYIRAHAYKAIPNSHIRTVEPAARSASLPQ